MDWIQTKVMKVPVGKIFLLDFVATVRSSTLKHPQHLLLIFLSPVISFQMTWTLQEYVQYLNIIANYRPVSVWVLESKILNKFNVNGTEEAYDWIIKLGKLFEGPESRGWTFEVDWKVGEQTLYKWSGL